MANDDFFDGLDEAENRLQEKQSKVRYWYEEGYVQGNEKDTDDEGDDSESEAHYEGTEMTEDTRASDLPSFLASKDATKEERRKKREDRGEALSDSDDHYEDVVPVARGGRLVRWGGLHGKLCLADGAPEEVPALTDLLDELLLPGAEAEAGQGGSSSSSVVALRGEAGTSAAEPEPEVAAVVHEQFPLNDRQAPGRWSYGAILQAPAASAARVDSAKVREMYALEDGQVNAQVRSTEDNPMTLMAIGNTQLRKQEREELIARARRDVIEARHAAPARGSQERLPGTRRPIALSQAWQERQGKQTVPAAPARRGMSMLPGSLSGSKPAAKPVQVAAGPELRFKGTPSGMFLPGGMRDGLESSAGGAADSSAGDWASETD